MEKDFMYLYTIVDLYTRKVLNWSISNSMNAEWCAEVLKEIIDFFGLDIFNIDQGAQYTSFEYTKVLLDNEILISLDGKARALDNIFVERLWRSVKYENVYLQSYKD